MREFWLVLLTLLLLFVLACLCCVLFKDFRVAKLINAVKSLICGSSYADLQEKTHILRDVESSADSHKVHLKSELAWNGHSKNGHISSNRILETQQVDESAVLLLSQPVDIPNQNINVKHLTSYATAAIVATKNDDPHLATTDQRPLPLPPPPSSPRRQQQRSFVGVDGAGEVSSELNGSGGRLVQQQPSSAGSKNIKQPGFVKPLPPKQHMGSPPHATNNNYCPDDNFKRPAVHQQLQHEINNSSAINNHHFDPAEVMDTGMANLASEISLLESRMMEHRQSIGSDSNSSDNQTSFLELNGTDRRCSGSSEDNFSDFEEQCSVAAPLTRAMSSESIDSSCSALELMNNDQFAGQLEIRLSYNKCEKCLSIWVVQAYELKATLCLEDPEVWVVVFLLPHPNPLWRTRLVKGTINPQFHEKYQQKIREPNVRRFALLCQIYTRVNDDVRLIGQCRIRLRDVELLEPSSSLWLNVSPPHMNTKGYNDISLGEVQFSLHYVPSTERLTVVMSRAKSVQRPDGSLPRGIFLKVYLVQSARKILKKKTSYKMLIADGSTTFNESMTFLLSQSYLHKVYLRISVVEVLTNGENFTIGHVTLGSRCADKGFGHWNQMIRSVNKPIIMWHSVLPTKTN